MFPDRPDLPRATLPASVRERRSPVPIATDRTSVIKPRFSSSHRPGVIVFLLSFSSVRRDGMPAKKTAHLPQTKIDFTPPQCCAPDLLVCTWCSYGRPGGLMTRRRSRDSQDYKIANSRSASPLPDAAVDFADLADRIFDGLAARSRLGLSPHRADTPCSSLRTAPLMLLTLSTYGHNPIVFCFHRVYFGVFGEILQPVSRTSAIPSGQVCHHQQRHALHRQRHPPRCCCPLGASSLQATVQAVSVGSRSTPAAALMACS